MGTPEPAIDATSPPRWFLIVGAPHTGCGRLAAMLRSHPEAGVCGELFAGRCSREPIPWAPVAGRQELVTLRRDNQVALLEELSGVAGRLGLRAFGFVLRYEQAERQPHVLNFLRGLPGLLVLHLTRRNRLRRFVDQELDRRGTAARPRSADVPQAPLRVDFRACALDFLRTYRFERLAEQGFAGWNVLTLSYEELVARTREVGERAVEFLGLSRCELAAAPPADATPAPATVIGNFDELRAGFRRWLDYFAS